MKTKGFTLIELLAVIVILAVIALIATPIIMNVIEDAKKGSFKDSAYGILNAVELYHARNIDTTVSTASKTFSFPNNELEFKGEKPASGNVMIDANGNISMAISDGKWCAVKEKNSSEIELNPYVEGDCTVVESTKESCFTFEKETITGYTCNDIKDVVIPKTINGQKVKTIGEAAFKNMGLTSVIIPNTVTRLEDNAFQENLITNISLPNSITWIGNWVFAHNKLKKVVIPDSITWIAAFVFASNEITEFQLSKNPNIDYISMGLFGNNRLTSIEIPENIKTIGIDAFDENYLKKVTIPSNVTEIGLRAFRHYEYSNPDLVSIVNTTKRAFDWSDIIEGKTGTPAITGTWVGVTVTDK